VRTIEAVARIAAGWTESTNAVKVLRVLCELAQEEPERLNPDLDHDAWGFEALDIGERLQKSFRVRGAVEWREDQDKARRRMKAYWTNLLETWDRQWPTIIDGMDVTGRHLMPRLELQEGGGTGNRNRYGFRFDVAEGYSGPHVQESLPRLDLLTIPQISYRQQDISGNRLVRWMSDRGFYLGGWGGRIYLGVSLVLIVLVALWIWLSLLAINAASTAAVVLKVITTSTMILWLAYLLLRWQIRLINDRITRAPGFLQPWSNEGDYLLELRKAEGAKRNTMYLVRYVANCPICGNHGLEMIRVESGRLEFFGRLVGRCNRAPNAHVFSFDHVSRAGRFLR